MECANANININSAHLTQNTINKNPMQTPNINNIINEDNLLEDSYSIDDESFHEEEEEPHSNSDTSSHKKVPPQSSSKDILFNSFISAIKEDDLNKIDTLFKNIQNHHMINRISNEGLTALQYAALYSSSSAVKFLIEHNANIDCQNAEGLPLLHLALVLALYSNYRQKAIGCYRYMYNSFPELRNQKDRLGRSVLHVILQFDIDDAIVKGDEIKEEDIALRDNNGVSAINYIYLFNAKKCFCKLVSFNNNNNNDIMNYIYKKEYKFIENCFVYYNSDIIQTIIKTAGKKFAEIKEAIYNTMVSYSSNEDSLIILNCKNAIEYLEVSYSNYNDYSNINTLINLPSFTSPNRKTLLIYNTHCTNHLKLPNDPLKHIVKRNSMFENSDRLTLLVSPPFGILQSSIFTSSSTFLFQDTSRKSTIADILKCHDITYISTIKSKCDQLPNYDSKLQIDDDTIISKYTYENIFNTSGCVMDAVDMVMSSKVSNAFALVRPPGHHAGYFGAVENYSLPKSNGFCIVNNVCIGAAYCKYKYKDDIKKIAIVDFDVHHGNGSEEIIQLLDSKSYTMKSNGDICNIEINKNIKNLWVDFDDAKNVLFISLHVYNDANPKSFYPYTGSSETNTKKNSDIYPGGIFNIPFNPNSPNGKYSYEYRDVFRSKVVPRLCKFEPDFVFISAGFDGHENEGINGGMMVLQEYDFDFITQQIQRVANRFAKGRVVSVLEGGYNVKTGIISSFVQCVMTHAIALNRAINMEESGDVMLTKVKRKREYEGDYEIFKKIERFKVKPRRSERLKHLEEERENWNGNSNGKESERSNEGNGDREKDDKDKEKDKEKGGFNECKEKCKESKD